MVTIESILASAVVSAVVALGTSEYRLRRKQSVKKSNETNEWYTEAAQLASRLQRTWRQKFEIPVQGGGFTGYDEVQKEMSLMHSQLNGHASKAQGKNVNQEVVDALDDTANSCQRISNITTHMSVRPEFEEKGDEAVKKAEELETKALKNISD